MISKCNLLWILPLAAGLGCFTTALFAGVRILDLQEQLEKSRRGTAPDREWYDDDREDCGLLSED